MSRSGRKLGHLLLAIAVVALVCAYSIAQSQSQDTSKTQSVPDAPSAAKPPVFPTPNATVPSRPVPSPEKPATQTAPDDQNANSAERNNATSPAPSSQVTTVPPGSAPAIPTSGHDQLEAAIKVTVNFVLVPVTVKTEDGRPFYGLTKDNFTVYEDGERKPLRFFTSDPFPISAAIVIDVGMPDVAFRKVNETLSSLSGSFSEFDEVAIYTYGNTVKQRQDFAAAASNLSDTTFRKLRDVTGRQGGVPVNQGPMASGPSVNGRPFDPGTPNPATQNTRSMSPSRVLNDAILRAAVDLSKRDRTRRKIIFVVSEGREDGSIASYTDVLKVLQSNEVTLYAVATGSAALPAYGTLEKIRLPRQGYGNILPKYAGATGGDVLTEFSKESIERAYAQITQQARNQYTIGYTTSASQTGSFRSIEVRVNRPNLHIFARNGYYPLPPPKK